MSLVVVCAVVFGGALVSVSAVADPARAQPAPASACKSDAALACRANCECRHTNCQTATTYMACDELGRMYRDGTPGVAGGVGAANPAEALKLFDIACWGGSGWWAGCSDEATALLKSGDSTVEPQARMLYSTGCDAANPRLSHEACYAFAQMCEAGRGGAKDVDAARAAYQKACNGGDTRGCDAAKRLDPASRVAPARPQPTGSPTSTPITPRIPPAGGQGRSAPVR